MSNTQEPLQQTLADLPYWLLLLVCLSGLYGELWRADVAGLSVPHLLKRVALRTGASTVFGLSTAMLAMAGGAEQMLAMALGSLTACLGADLVSGLYVRWLKRRAGVE